MYRNVCCTWQFWFKCISPAYVCLMCFRRQRICRRCIFRIVCEFLFQMCIWVYSTKIFFFSCVFFLLYVEYIGLEYFSLHYIFFFIIFERILNCDFKIVFHSCYWIYIICFANRIYFYCFYGFLIMYLLFITAPKYWSSL